MSYRDDLESALARVDALGAENERLAADNARLAEENAQLAARAEKLRGEVDSLGQMPREGLTASARYGVRIGFSILMTLVIFGGAALGVMGMWHGCRAVSSSRGTQALTGKLDVTGAGLGGTWALVPASCASGQAKSFHGVDLIDETDAKRILRIVEDPAQGMLVKINVPGTEDARFITRTDCKTWDVQIRPTNHYVNDIRVLEGLAAFDCKLADGSTLAGRVEFQGCR